MHLLRCVTALLVVGAAVLGCSTSAVDCNCPATPPRGGVYTGRQGCQCAAMVCSDIGPVIDLGAADVGSEPPRDATVDAHADAPLDAAADDRAVADGTGEVSVVGDVIDATDVYAPPDAAFDAGADAHADVPPDIVDARVEAGFFDVRNDVGVDGGLAADASDRDVVVTIDLPVVSTDIPTTTVDLGVRDAGPPLVCDYGALPLTRTCGVDGECVAGLLSLDCCGTQHALGYNGAFVVQFNLLAALCTAAVTPDGGRACGCANRGIQLDNGLPAPISARIGAVCISGTCTSVALP